MNKRNTTILQSNLKPADPVEWGEIHAAIERMIRAGGMEQAHLRLLELVKVYFETAEYWLLLAWTAPDFPSAEAFFTRLVCRFPNHPKATGEVPWSGKAWVQTEVMGEDVPREAPKEATESPKLEPASTKWDTIRFDETPTAMEVEERAGPKERAPTEQALIEQAMAPTEQALEEQAMAPTEQAATAARPEALVWGNARISEREARWLMGIIPGTESESTRSVPAGSVPAGGAIEEKNISPEIAVLGEAGAVEAPVDWDRPAFDAGVLEWMAEDEQRPARPVDSTVEKASTAEDRGAWEGLAFDAGVMEGMAEAERTPGGQADGVGEEKTPAAQPADSALRRLLARIRRINFTRVLVLYMGGITLAEVLTSFASPHLGLVVHGVLLVLILVHSAVKDGSKEQRFLLALGMAPLIRLMSLSLPLLKFDFVYWYMIIGIPLLAAAWVVYRLSRYKAAQVGLGWGRLLPAQLVIGLSGVGLGFMEYLILKPEPLVESFSLANIWRPALILLVFTGFLEELIFRGLMQQASVNTLKKYGPVYISALFAVLHIGYKSWIDLVFVFLVGFAFSIVVQHTRSLAGVTLAHGLTNISLFLVFPFLVSLQSADILPPPAQPITGPALWSGSAGRQPLPVLRQRVTATETPWLPTPTDTLVASPLPVLVEPALPSSTPTATRSLLPTPSYTATRVVRTTASATPRPTATPTPTITATPTVTLALPPTATATITLVPTDDLPVEPTATATITPIPTDDLPAEPTATVTITPVPTDVLPLEPTPTASDIPPITIP